MQIDEWEREQGTCHHGGHQRADCADSERVWYPQRTVCYHSMVLADAQARYDEQHKTMQWHDGSFESWGSERSPEHPFHFKTGVTIWLAESDLTPHDHFLGGKRDCPECSGGGAVDREEDDGGEQQP